MEWLVIALPILGGMIGIYLGRNKHRTYKKHQAYQIQQLFLLLALSNKRNLVFDGVYDFQITEKILKSYRGNHQYYFNVQTTSNKYEHLLPIYKTQEYNKRKEGDIVPLGLVRNTKKPDIYMATFQTEPTSAIKAVTKRANSILALLLAVMTILLFNIGLLIYIFFIN